MRQDLVVVGFTVGNMIGIYVKKINDLEKSGKSIKKINRIAILRKIKRIKHHKIFFNRLDGVTDVKSLPPQYPTYK